MAKNIVTKTVSSEANQRLSLTSAAYVRPMDFGSNWSHIRIAARVAVNINTGTTDIPAPNFFLGLTSGSSAVPGTATPNHFLGIRTPSSISFFNNEANYVFTSNTASSSLGCMIIDGVETTSITGNTFGYTFLGNASTMATVFCIEIIKGSPNYTIDYSSSINGGVYPTSAIFENIMASGASVFGDMRIKLNDAPFAVDEATNGPLDSICLSWGSPTVELEILDLNFARLAE